MTAAMRIGRLAATTGAFGMKHAAGALPDLPGLADRNELTCREFLGQVPSSEAEERFARRRNYASAHLPPGVRPIGEFDPAELEGGITAARLKELDWPGLSKTTVAPGPGLLAVDNGYTVALERMGPLIETPDKADVDREAGLRLRYLRKCQLVIVDEIGYTPITKQRANRFFSFVSDAYGRVSMVFTTNREVTWWKGLMGDQALVTATLDQILHHARCFSLRGEPYRLRHPELYATE